MEPDTLQIVSPLRYTTRRAQALSSSPTLLEGDEARGLARADSGPSVLAWLVGDGELCQVVADHLRLDLNLVEGLAIVHANDAANHLGHDNHVAEVRPHGVGLVSSSSLLSDRQRSPGH